MVRQVGPLHALRALGQRLLPKGRLRSFANTFLLAWEHRRGRPFDIAGRRLRFLPGSDPQIARAGAPAHERFDTLQIERFTAAIRPHSLIADVGAHRGEYTVIAAALAERGHVFAFEPVADNLEFIRRNLALNQLGSRATLVQKAAASDNGRTTFFMAGSSSSNSTLRGAIEGSAQGSMQEVTVETITLDAFFQERGMVPHVVKIDVEGAEFAVLRGAAAIVRSDAVILCELHPYAWREAGHDGDELRAWLAQHGRTIMALDADTPITDWRYGPVRLVRTV